MKLTDSLLEQEGDASARNSEIVSLKAEVANKTDEITEKEKKLEEMAAQHKHKSICSCRRLI